MSFPPVNSVESTWRSKLAALSFMAVISDILMVIFFWTMAPLKGRFSAGSATFHVFDALSHGGTAVLVRFTIIICVFQLSFDP